MRLGEIGHVIAWRISPPHTIATHCATLSNSQIYCNSDPALGVLGLVLGLSMLFNPVLGYSTACWARPCMESFTPLGPVGFALGAVRLCVVRFDLHSPWDPNTCADSREPRGGVAGTSKRVGASMGFGIVKERHAFWGA